MNSTTEPRKVHEGRNLKRIREILGVKQETLAIDLGISQQAISNLEQRETIEPDMLQEIAGMLKVPVEAIRNFDEEKTIFNISCSFSDNAVNNNAYNIQHINPIDKWVEAIEKIENLYERLLQSEKDKAVMLERLVKG